MRLWKKLPPSALHKAEFFLREREIFCVNAVSRFNSAVPSKIWAAMHPSSDCISALLLFSKRLLFPVFHFSQNKVHEFTKDRMPLPWTLPVIMKKEFLHAVQGLALDMDILEYALEKQGFISASKYDYELRSLELTKAGNTSGGMQQAALLDLKTRKLKPQGLLIRRARASDTDNLLPLQAAYEQEEVLPIGAHFNFELCRKGLEYLIAENMILTAELKGRLVGKININAQSYTRFQIGGVYVVPELRGLGIAKVMTTELIREFAPQKNNFTLFVKKTNLPALRIYDKLGFEKIGDYRISYY